MKSIKLLYSKIKVKESKKTHFSAPYHLSVFIISCMIVIFSLETLGLLNNKKNLDFRMPSVEVSIKHYAIENRINTSSDLNIHKLNKSIFVGLTDSKTEALNTKREQLSFIDNIIIRAAEEQLEFEYGSTLINNNFSSISIDSCIEGFFIFDV